MHRIGPTIPELALAAFALSMPFETQAQADPWVGRWGAPRCGEGETEIVLDRSTLDLSTFETTCRVRNVRQRAAARFEIEANCSGEGRQSRMTFTVEVSGSVLTFVSMRGFDFDPKRFQKCAARGSATGAPSAASSGSQRVAAPGLPLTRGYYVAEGTPCSQASNGTLSLLRRDGMGAGRELCQFRSIERLSESRYRVRENCSEGGEKTVLYEILGQTRYRMTNATGFSYSARYCEQSQLPLPWKTIDLDDLIR